MGSLDLANFTLLEKCAANFAAVQRPPRDSSKRFSLTSICTRWIAVHPTWLASAMASSLSWKDLVLSCFSSRLTKVISTLRNRRRHVLIVESSLPDLMSW